jgi:hypothetical protein
MTEITKKLLEKELKRYKLLREQKEHSNYYDGLMGVIRRLLKILDEGYVEEKDKVCPFVRRTGYAWQYICEEEHCQCWSTKRNDCGLKMVE